MFSTIFFLVKKGDLLKHISLNERVERAAVRRGLKSLLYLTCIYLVREIVFLYGKRQAILKSNVYSNHVPLSSASDSNKFIALI